VTLHRDDINGNTEDATPISTVKDTVAPTAPGIQLDVLSDTGVSSSDWITSLATPHFTLTGEAGASPTVYVDGVVYTGQVLAPAVTLDDHTHDRRGVAALATGARPLFISTSGSLHATFTLDNGATLTNNRALGLSFSVTDPSPTATLTITANGVTIYNGMYANTPVASLAGADGLYTLTATITDQAGNAISLSRTITLDTLGPAVTAALGATTNGTAYDASRLVVTRRRATRTVSSRRAQRSIPDDLHERRHDRPRLAHRGRPYGDGHRDRCSRQRHGRLGELHDPPTAKGIRRDQ
jgi:hypothetical protein